jgi:hypothetical protein
MCKQCARTDPSAAHTWAVRDQAVREQREGAARGRAGSRHGAAEWEGREQTVSRESSRRLTAHRKQQQSETRDSAGAAAESDSGGSGERHGGGTGEELGEHDEHDDGARQGPAHART